MNKILSLFLLLCIICCYWTQSSKASKISIVPNSNTQWKVHDSLTIEGTESQLEEIKRYLKEQPASATREDIEKFPLTKFKSLPEPWSSEGVTPSSVVCERNKNEQCAKGSVQVSDWYAQAFQTQMTLQKDKPLNKASILGTHNSHITYADGYGVGQQTITKLLQRFSNQAVQISNQWVTVTDQLNMGIRHVELDTHYIHGELRICHAGGIHIKWMNDIVHQLEKMFNVTIHWDSETIGCFSKNNPTFEQALQEIDDWQKVNNNPWDFIWLYLDNNIDLKRWEVVNKIHEAITNVFGADTVLDPKTKQEKWPNSWPTMTELHELGIRVIITTGTDFGKDNEPYLFPIDSLWSESSSVETFEPYPACKPDRTKRDFYRLFGTALWYAWFQQDKSYIPASLLSGLTQCGTHFNFYSLELVTPELVESFIWTFKQNTTMTPGCLYMVENDDSFHIQKNCSTLLPTICEYPDPKIPHATFLAVSTTATPWKDGNIACGATGKPYVPTSYPELLRAKALLVPGKTFAAWVAYQLS